MDRVVADTMLDTQHSVIPPVMQILVWFLYWDPLPRCPIHFILQLVCVNFVDDQHKPLFDAHFQFYRFADQNKGNFCDLVHNV
jgi:hypothetical protein